MVGASLDITSDLPETLLLWDVDHTLIENGGVSKATYVTAFEMLTEISPTVRPSTDGRTDLQIMRELFVANSVDSVELADVERVHGVLVDAMRRNSPDLPRKGYVLPGVVHALTTLAEAPNVVQSVLTGNVAPNARVKLAAFGLDKWIDLDVGGFGSDDIVRSNLVGASRRKVADKYGIDFDQSSTILVGDTVLDVRAARDGGAKIIGVATGVYSVGQLAEAGADFVLDDLADWNHFASTLLSLRNRP